MVQVNLFPGTEGYAINFELREGKQHCQNGTVEFLQETIRLCKKLTDGLIWPNNAAKTSQRPEKEKLYMSEVTGKMFAVSSLKKSLPCVPDMTSRIQDKIIHHQKGHRHSNQTDYSGFFNDALIVICPQIRYIKIKIRYGGFLCRRYTRYG